MEKPMIIGISIAFVLVIVVIVFIVVKRRKPSPMDKIVNIGSIDPSEPWKYSSTINMSKYSNSNYYCILGMDPYSASKMNTTAIQLYSSSGSTYLSFWASSALTGTPNNQRIMSSNIIPLNKNVNISIEYLGNMSFIIEVDGVQTKASLMGDGLVPGKLPYSQYVCNNLNTGVVYISNVKLNNT
jgi:hypothetical protein